MKIIKFLFIQLFKEITQTYSVKKTTENDSNINTDDTHI